MRLQVVPFLLYTYAQRISGFPRRSTSFLVGFVSYAFVDLQVLRVVLIIAVREFTSFGVVFISYTRVLLLAIHFQVFVLITCRSWIYVLCDVYVNSALFILLLKCCSSPSHTPLNHLNESQSLTTTIMTIT